MGIINEIIDKNRKIKANGKDKLIEPLINENPMENIASIFNIKTAFLGKEHYNFEQFKKDIIVKKFLSILNNKINLAGCAVKWCNSIKHIDKKNNKEILDKYKKLPENGLFHPGDCNSDAEKNSFSASLLENENGKYFRTQPENVLERLIKLSFRVNGNLNYENQIPIPDSNTTSHIDLIERRENLINFIELKQWNNNPPLWAVAEVIKNLYMFLYFSKQLDLNKEYFKIYLGKSKHTNYETFKEIFDFSKVQQVKLTILAPCEYYYDNFTYNGIFEINAFENYLLFCEEFKKQVQEDLSKQNIKLDIKISTEYFTFSRKRYNELIGKDVDKYKGSITEEFITKNNIKFIKQENTDKWILQPAQNKQKDKQHNTGEIDLEKQLISGNIIKKNDIAKLSTFYPLCTKNDFINMQNKIQC